MQDTVVYSHKVIITAYYKTNYILHSSFTTSYDDTNQISAYINVGM
jgi:hypothetical protein